MKEKNIIFFDGVCHLCDSFVNFIYQKDPLKQFLYSPLQGLTAQNKLNEADRRQVTTLIFIKEDKIFRGPKAIEEILSLIYPRASKLLKLLPQEWIYNLVAKNRFLFGQKKTNTLTEEQKQYFLP